MMSKDSPTISERARESVETAADKAKASVRPTNPEPTMGERMGSSLHTVQDKLHDSSVGVMESGERIFDTAKAKVGLGSGSTTSYTGQP